MPPKKDQKESNNKTDQTQNATSSPKIQTNSSPAKETSPDKNLNKNFISKENYFGVKASPTHGIGKTLSSGTHSPILNYYSNVSSEGKDYYYSPKEGNNQNSFNSNKISPMNFNYSPSTIFNMPKNNNQNKDLSNNEEDSKTLQEKMEPLVSNLNMNSDNNNFMMRVASFPSNGSNLQDKNEEEEEEEILTLSIDSGEENYLLGMDKDKNLQFNLNEQEKKEGKGIHMFPDGEKYEGNFKNSKFEGKGVLYYADGDRYEGDFKNNKRHGSGIMYYKSDGKIAKSMGDFLDDKPSGKHVFLQPDGSVTVEIAN